MKRMSLNKRYFIGLLISQKSKSSPIQECLQNYFGGLFYGVVAK